MCLNLRLKSKMLLFVVANDFEGGVGYTDTVGSSSRMDSLYALEKLRVFLLPPPQLLISRFLSVKAEEVAESSGANEAKLPL